MKYCRCSIFTLNLFDMNNSSKISYWNHLRKLNIKTVIVSGVLFITIIIIFLGFQKFTSFFFDPLMLNVIPVMALDLLVYLAIVNAFLLLLEVIDGMMNVRRIPILKKIFKILMLILAIVPMILYIAFLILADPKYIHLLG